VLLSGRVGGFARPHMWHDSSIRVPGLIICVTWLFYICDMTHSYVWHDSSIRVPWLIICLTWLIHTCARTHYRCDTTRPHISHDSSIYLTCCSGPLSGGVRGSASPLCDMTHLHPWHDASAYLTRLIHILNMLQWAAEWRSSWVCKSLMWHDSFTSVTWHIYISDTTHPYVLHDAVGRWVVESWVCRSRAFPFLGRLLCGWRGWPWLPTPPGAHMYMKTWCIYKCYSIYVTHICMCMHIHIHLYNSICMYTYIYTTKCANATPYTWPIYVCVCIYICIYTTQYVCIRIAHGGDQTENSWISRLNSFPVFSIWVTGTPVYSRENVFEILGTLVKTCLKFTWNCVKTC